MLMPYGVSSSASAVKPGGKGLPTAVDTDQVFKDSLKSQYHAALSMLREAVELCSEEMWFNDKHVNAFWQIAYHTLYLTHLYLQPNEQAFRPWAQHQADVQNPDGFPGPADPTSTLPLIPKPYTRGQVLEYLRICDAMVDSWIDRLDLTAPADGFSWKKNVVPTIEFQIGNLRHLQHGVAQMATRLRTEADQGIQWVGTGRSAVK
jgi:hypothetical protein